jgi:hypothetical protein
VGCSCVALGTPTRGIRVQASVGQVRPRSQQPSSRSDNIPVLHSDRVGMA